MHSNQHAAEDFAERFVVAIAVVVIAAIAFGWIDDSHADAHAPAVQARR